MIKSRVNILKDPISCQLNKEDKNGIEKKMYKINKFNFKLNFNKILF